MIYGKFAVFSSSLPSSLPPSMSWSLSWPLVSVYFQRKHISQILPNTTVLYILFQPLVFVDLLILIDAMCHRVLWLRKTIGVAWTAPSKGATVSKIRIVITCYLQLIGPWEIWLYFSMCSFWNTSQWLLSGVFIVKLSSVDTGLNQCYIGPGSGLVPPGSKPLPEPILTKIHETI